MGRDLPDAAGLGLVTVNGRNGDANRSAVGHLLPLTDRN